MANKGFDLAAVLGGVPELNTGDEQIVRIPLDLIDPDPENFYSLDGLDELAGNIELLGLMDPIRVRPNGERYTVVSGHRRRAACLLIRDGGSSMFDQGVPCIVEYGEASDAMRKLRLIYANANTRQLTSAEQSRQAEEVTRLLYELKNEGVEFPGRMRDHVAQACGVSKSKIARLHAIRENLVPGLLCYYDSGEMVEDVAYQLSRFPSDIQTALADRYADGKKRKMPSGSTVQAVYANLAGYQKPIRCRAHAGGPDCHHTTARIVHSLGQQDSWSICNTNQCCMDCYKSKGGCSGACREARDRASVEKAADAEKQAEQKRAAEAAQSVLKDRIQKRAKLLLPYAEKVGLADSARISNDFRSATVGQLQKWAAGDMQDSHFYGDEAVRPGNSKDAVNMAKRLGCSIELALDIPERPAAHNNEPAWETEAPPHVGWYAVRIRMYSEPVPTPRVFWWDGESWLRDREKNLLVDKAFSVTGWVELPYEAET